MCPESETMLANFRPVAFYRALFVRNLPIPIVWPFDDLEKRCIRGFRYANDTHSHCKKGERINRMLVQPAYGGKMFIAERRCNPNHRMGFQPRQISHNLAKVGVIRSLKLVFDQNYAVVGGVASEDVGAESANAHLGTRQFQRDADCYR